MKRNFPLLLTLALLCALLAGCAGRAVCPPSSPDGGAGGEADKSAARRCRVVSVSDDNVLLADVDSEYPDIYTLPVDGADAVSGFTVPAVGAMVEITYGSILETYPARFAEVRSVTVLEDEFDDRCALYLRVLNDLWDKDEGLNSSGVEYISVDLSATSLSPAERSAAAWTFAQAHGAMPLELNYEQLCAEGYIDGLEGENAFPAWENGVLFTVTETDDPVAFALPSAAEGGEGPSMAQYNVKNTVCFDASKWRTALGAYGLSKCVAVQDNNGVWGDYHINGGEWIS